jgi:acyl-CoA reductase-like NAD-dependent aldehyde dehydrogenase
LPIPLIRRKLAFVKRITEANALDKAVKALTMATEKSWSRLTPQQQIQKLQDLKKLMDTFSETRSKTPASNRTV